MHVQRFDTPHAFADRVEAFLLAQEATHSLLISIIGQLLATPDIFGAPPYLAVVADGDATNTVALRTSPWPLQLSLTTNRAALPMLTDDVHDFYGAVLSGVNGPTESVSDFVTHYSIISGQPAKLKLKQRIFRLDRVIPVVGVDGQFRKAHEADRPVLQQWLPAFYQEARGEERNSAAIARTIDYYLKLANSLPGIYVWDWAGEAVAMASATGQTPHGIRVINVYTPPEKRRNGYASALVAALSQHNLDHGREFCALETDQCNPTANHIYQAIGYRPVCDAAEYTFSA